MSLTLEDRKIVLLFGPPGAGKGTVAPQAKDTLKIPHLSTGDMLRAVKASGSDLGKKVAESQDKGQFVPSEIVNACVAEAIRKDDCKNGFLLDGYPRTLDQAQFLDKTLSEMCECVTDILKLEVETSKLEARICGRWTHLASGRSYHVDAKPPKKFAEKRKADPNCVPSVENGMVDDDTGEDLIQRSDDTKEVLKQRLDEYANKTMPIVDYFANPSRRTIIPLPDGGGICTTHTIDAGQDPAAVDKTTKDKLALITNRKQIEIKKNETNPRKIIILTGPPGGGKGTVADAVTSALGNIPQLSTGDILRGIVKNEPDSDLGKKIAEVQKSGGLADDSLMAALINKRIQQKDCSDGFLLDGFPRTLGQMKWLTKVLKTTGEQVQEVFALTIPDSKLEERICGRWTHVESGRSYNAVLGPPKSFIAAKEKDANVKASAENMLDDVTGEPLYQRPDDNPDALKKRLDTYHKETEPIQAEYSKIDVLVTVVNADRDKVEFKNDASEKAAATGKRLASGGGCCVIM